jgi:L-aspartate oxidase
MEGVHPLADLAPRDVVAAAMHRRMTASSSSHLWLDATGLGRSYLDAHFPNVTAACRAIGIDPANEPIPVAPGAHYACGGVRADMVGKTSVDGLFAVGEVAATGVHGANRLASNSLPEAIAAGRRLGQALGQPGSPGDSRPTAGGVLEGPGTGPGVDPAGRDALADAMSSHAGVIRHGEGLEHLLEVLADQPAAPAQPLDLTTVEATNLHAVSMLVATAALARTESRGCHRRSDAPNPRAEWAHRIAITAGPEDLVLRPLPSDLRSAVEPSAAAGASR